MINKRNIHHNNQRPEWSLREIFGYSATSTTAVGVLIKYRNKNHDNILTPRQTAGVNVHIHPTAPPPIKTRR